MLQPQLLGAVPIPITCAWVMVAIGAWQLATTDHRPPTANHRSVFSVVGAATLVLLLDLQIETVATKINPYWAWLDTGPYYGVPAANFAAWWLVGLGMTLVVAYILRRETRDARQETRDKRPETRDQRPETSELCFAKGLPSNSHVSSLMSHISYLIPAYLYLLSTVMFTVVNLARGYVAAGLVGGVVLLVVALAANLKPATLNRDSFSTIESSETTES
jgi:putative membrane protein